MKNLDVKIRGNGFYKSEDDFTLSINRDDEDYWFTLHGRRAMIFQKDDDRVQFDFNIMTRDEIEEMYIALGLILESSNT